ncbi:ATP-binding cassette domain-containing protein [Arhodomonas aquaeolei]|uniref:ABC transporter ATP-binding protein n=1 Tax=Arhodomonas aquaeolei TaxID=2369 RepID=UPI002169604C|nr:ATP-binding cassette domain-containing protein [Arhodomonas aquaeolei]MCS4505257.1 ATP-binding cassette domain-containing protein [Arhodomonas aquaeolei]
MQAGPVTVDDLRVEHGECVALTGPSGSGKTRLLRALADLDPFTGRLALDGIACAAMSGPEWRARVMYVPAESAWWADRVDEHFPPGTAGGDLEVLGLGAEVLTWPVARLSSGERQRLALLRAAARTPRMLLLDEPTANLDRANARRAEDWLAGLRERGCGLLWVSHDGEQVMRVASRGYTIAAGGRLTETAWT